MSATSQPDSPSGAPQFQMPDWSAGHYERFATELEPAAEHLVELAALCPGERVLDLGCGTGNAAVLAARAGATVTGLDPAPRLLDVARGRLSAERLDGTFVIGDAHALPFEDGAFDVVLSVFGVIFAADAERALAEILRVLAPNGRALVSVWLPGGAIDAMVGVMVRAISAALGAELPRFPWHDPAALGVAAATAGASVRARQGEVVFSASSPESYLCAQEADHPMTIASRPLLEHAGTYPTVRAEALEALRRDNEDPARFRATSRYRVIELRHTR